VPVDPLNPLQRAVTDHPWDCPRVIALTRISPLEHCRHGSFQPAPDLVARAPALPAIRDCASHVKPGASRNEEAQRCPRRSVVTRLRLVNGRNGCRQTDSFRKRIALTELLINSYVGSQQRQMAPMGRDSPSRSSVITNSRVTFYCFVFFQGGGLGPRVPNQRTLGHLRKGRVAD
jgi:hypothetical protein